MEDPSQKPHLPFDGDTTMALARALDLNLKWLSDRGNDSGTIHVGLGKDNGRRSGYIRSNDQRNDRHLVSRDTD
jgi:hypothetical protein